MKKGKSVDQLRERERRERIKEQRREQKRGGEEENEKKGQRRKRTHENVPEHYVSNLFFKDKKGTVTQTIIYLFLQPLFLSSSAFFFFFSTRLIIIIIIVLELLWTQRTSMLWSLSMRTGPLPLSPFET